MRRMSVVDGLTVGFPHRSAEFLEGFEIGCLAVALGHGPARHLAALSPAAAEQAEDLARGLGYRVIRAREGEGTVDMTFLRADVRPKLMLAASDGASLRAGWTG